MAVMRHLTVDGTTYDTVGEASVTQVQTSGTKIATVSIDGTSTDIYAPSSATPTSHTHGDITNGGDITAAAPTVASGDKLIINDESASKITNGPSFGSSTTTFLANNGTWQTPTGSYSLPTASTSQLGGVKVDGSTITIDNSGVISASGGGGGVSYRTATVTIPTTGWSSNSITVNVTGVTASNDVIVAPAPSSAEAWAAAGMLCTAQGAGTLTFTRTSANSAALTANVMVFNGRSAPLYSITNNSPTSLTIDKAEASEGETVTLTCSGSGTVLVVLSASQSTVSWLSVSANVPVTFTMPAGDVTVSATIK